jgi:UDP-N-acetyl-2-amino-2-deoxyglucuronate dehydrogenase
MGIHFVDLLVWLFGACESSEVHARSREKVVGSLTLERAHVRFILSTDAGDLPAGPPGNTPPAHRSLTVDGQDVDFSDPRRILHVAAYREVLEGRGLGIKDLMPSLKVACGLRDGPVGDSPLREPAGSHEKAAAGFSGVAHVSGQRPPNT